MPPTRFLLGLASTACITLACASGSGGSSEAEGSAASVAPTDRQQMDTLEFRNLAFNSIFDAIQARHADWLRPSGAPTQSSARGRSVDQPSLGVFIDGQQRPQGIEYLKLLQPNDVLYVRHIGASEALNTYNWKWSAIVVKLGH